MAQEQCLALKKDGTRCRQRAKDGHKFCVVHLNYTGSLAEGDEIITQVPQTESTINQGVTLEYGPTVINVGSKWVGKPVSEVLDAARTLFALDGDGFEALLNGEDISDESTIIPESGHIIITKGRSVLG